ncbi:MAG: YeeE/YedE family protein [Candidatus Pacebacteria bacterium]|nr:YeeE/YedE family protein [Candidatus Paceibacterota bacterium]
MLESLFPQGVDQYLVGGLLVGVGIAIPFIFTGLVVGVSSFFTTTWSYVHKGWFFQTDWYRKSRGWKWFLVAGLISGGFLFVFMNGENVVTEVVWWRLLVGGILVGIGTRMSGGCTSGHGICGLASLEKVSLVATVTFLATAIVVALFTQSLFI